MCTKSKKEFFRPCISRASQEATTLAKEIDITPSMPRVSGRRKHRANVQQNSVEDHYRVNLFIPFIDYMVVQVWTIWSQFYKGTSMYNRESSIEWQIVPEWENLPWEKIVRIGDYTHLKIKACGDLKELFRNVVWIALSWAAIANTAGLQVQLAIWLAQRTVLENTQRKNEMEVSLMSHINWLLGLTETCSDEWHEWWTSLGFEPTTSRLPGECSTNWATGAG